ncbi:MAG: hypothetical protein HQK81_12765 [Desulfovibrionaceae bacterium]|nr:hypothetical protein [Desulfovibrionaceae bacterium]MBF0514916.1 hypothetical protein [Desulfovibrionaceae bacterium]
MAGPIGAVAAASYARSAQLTGQSVPSKGQPSGVAKMVTQSYGFRLGPLGIEYSRKEVDFSPASGAAAATSVSSASSNSPGVADAQNDAAARFAAAESMRQIQDQMPDCGAATEQADNVSVLPRGLAAYAQSALGKDKNRRGSVQAVV